jgi:hypothetical protein
MRGFAFSAKGYGVLAPAFVKSLPKFKRYALRQGVWFTSISRIERGIIDLTYQYVEIIKSKKLAKIVTAILEKLQFAVETVVDRLVRTRGLSLARKLSTIAVCWGNISASKWSNDRAFARYLAFCLSQER